MRKKLKKLENILKFKFKNLDLLKRSLTHKSFDTENNYEKLEFLGDRVLGLAISKKLIDLYPDENEGVLDKRLASLVNKNKCCEIGRSLKLEEFVFLGDNKKKGSLIENKIISDCCEALIGAMYVDKGYDIAEKFILTAWSELLKSSNVTQIDPKTRLQEFSLKKYKDLPIYKLITSTGPKHKPSFKVAVRLKNSKFVEAIGTSKKNAEQAAAKEFLKNISKL